MTTSPVKRFEKAVTTATLVDPHRLALRILADSADRRSTLRAATYEAKVSVGARADSQPEKMLELAPPVLPIDRDNFRTLDRAVVRALDAVSILNAECHDRGSLWDSDAWRHDDWDEMRRTAAILIAPVHPDSCQHHKTCQATACHDTCPRRTCHCRSLIGDALAVDREIHGSLHSFANAITTIRAVQRRYSRRAPSKWQQMSEAGHTPDTICDPCASTSPPEFHGWDNKARHCCRWYNDLWNRNAQRPPHEIVQAKHHAPQTVYRAMLSKWERECEQDRLDDLAQGA